MTDLTDSPAGYSGPARLELTVQPSRAAYLIQAGNRSEFRRAVQEASVRWGGMLEPIIPVPRSRPIGGSWEQLVELAGVTGIVNIGLSPERAKEAARQLKKRVVKVSRIDGVESPVHYTTNPLSIPLREIWGRAAITTAAAPSSPLWMATLAGEVGPSEQSYIATEQLPIRQEAIPDQLARTALQERTLIDQTSAGITERRITNGPGALPMTVWLTRRNSLLDCLYFWNMRAIRLLGYSRSPMCILPLDDLSYWLEFKGAVAAVLANRSYYVDPDAIFASVSCSREQVDNAARNLGLTPSSSSVISSRFTDDRRQAPFTYLNSVHKFDPITLLIADREYGVGDSTQVFFQDGTASVNIPSPVPWTRPGKTLLQMHSQVFATLPKATAVADLVVRNSQWREDAIELRTDCRLQYFLEFSLPSLDSCLYALARENSYKFELSDKGRIVGSVEAQAPALLNKQVAYAANALVTPRSKTLAREMLRFGAGGRSLEQIQEIAMRWGGRSSRKYASCESLGFRATDASRALETLCVIRWAERGLEIRCTNCGVTSFVPLAETSAEAQCPGCNSKQSHTAERNGVKMYYRLNSQVDRAVDQGAIPVLMLLATLKKRFPGAHLLPGVNISKSELNFEIDVFGICNALVVAGEVKTFANQFSKKQLREDIAKSSAVNADVHIMSCQESIERGLLEFAEEECARREIGLWVYDDLAV